MSKIYYSNGNDELCHDIDYWYQDLEDRGINSMELTEMKFDKKNCTKFCTLHQELLDGGECGAQECEEYAPANGSRGRCTFKSHTLEETKKKITITTYPAGKILNISGFV